MITIKALLLLLYRPGEACGLIDIVNNVSANISSVWFFPLGCYIPQCRVLENESLRLHAQVLSKLCNHIRI